MTATETTACPGCAAKVRYAVGHAGRRFRCRCQAVSRLPDAPPVMVDLLARSRSNRHHSAPAVELVGLAVPFGVASHQPYPGYGRVQFLTGAFDARLRCVSAGLGKVALLDSHDWGQVFASTAAGSLALWADADGLYVAVRGAQAMAAVRSIPGRRFLSVGFNIADGRADRDHLGPLTTVHKATVGEVSLVRHPNFPDTAVHHWNRQPA